MRYLRSAGLWLLCGSLEVLFMIHLAEFLHPDYSVSEDFVSHLGVGPMPSSAVFAAGLVIFGFMMFVAAYLLRGKYPKSAIWWMIAVTGFGAAGVGIFNMDSFYVPHAIFALLAFVIGNVATIYSHKLVKPPLSWIAILLGVIGLSALVLMIGGVYFGLGEGGMERMVLYPPMFWFLGFGAYLMATDE